MSFSFHSFHFSKYGLQDSDEEEEERPSKTSTKKLKTAPLPPAGQATPFQMALNGKPAPPPQVETGQWIWMESMIQKLKASHSASTKLFYDPSNFEEYKCIGSHVKTSTRGRAWGGTGIWCLLERFKEFSFCLDRSFYRLSFLNTPPLSFHLDLLNSVLSDQLKIVFCLCGLMQSKSYFVDYLMCSLILLPPWFFKSSVSFLQGFLTPFFSSCLLILQVIS